MIHTNRRADLVLAGIAALAYCSSASCDGLVGSGLSYRESILVEQPMLSSVNSNLYIGTHDKTGPCRGPSVPGQLSYYEMAGGRKVSSIPQDQMNMVLWADDETVRLHAASSSTHFTPWTGLQVDSPYALHQAATDALWPGSSGFQVKDGEIGINIHSPDFPVHNEYCKATSVLQYDFSRWHYPFRYSYQDEIEFSFDLRVKTSDRDTLNKGQLNVLGYLLINEATSGHQRTICLGAAAFDPRIDQAEFNVMNDPDSGCLIVNLPLGHIPELNLSDQATTAMRQDASPDYYPYKLTVNATGFREVLKRSNEFLSANKKPLLSYRPEDYYVSTLVFNPEAYLPDNSNTYAHLGLSVKNLKLVARQTYPLMGYVDEIRQQGANWIVDGWACARAWNTPITVALFGGQSHERGGDLLTVATANLPNLASENQVCGTTTGTPHRFQATLPASAVSATNTAPLYIHAVRSGSPDPSVLLAKSGQYQIGNGAVSVLPTKQVYRWVSGNDRAYSTDPHEYDGTGYVLDTKASPFRIKSTPSTGAVPLYRCSVIGRVDHFLWTAADCNGQIQEGLLGYIEANAIQGTRPLYLFYHPSSQVHLSTTELGEGWSSEYELQYTPQAQFGYVW
ncbi:hypothetical protein [Lysobacter sp. CA199]|uniref:hypothetical protein n=1 Tax=Lysobacter sp. CA199 TaxID=3455608 RepID=UPI003F8D89E3